jgi:hypothetical protein
MTRLADFGLVREEAKGCAYSSVQIDPIGMKITDPFTGLPARSAPTLIADGVLIDDLN